MKLVRSLFILAGMCVCDTFGWIPMRFPRSGALSEMRLPMSDPDGLIEAMRKTLGDRNDVSELAEAQSRELMKGLKDLDRDPNMRINNKFVEWLDSNGVWVKSQSTWGRAQHPLVISSNTEDNGESCGRGMLAKESIGEGELLLTVPLDLCLTRAVAQQLLGKNIIPDYMDEYISIAVLLMTERVKGSSSRWKPYLDVLPSIEDVNPAYVWPEQELEMLIGSPTYPAAKSLRRKIEAEYEELKNSIFSRNLQMFPLEKYTFDLFLWAFVMLFSRAARLTSKIAGEELALVPYADLMNHNPYSNTYIDAQRSGMPLISKSEEVAVYADRGYKKFEQVYISYGEKSNSDLLLLYGFALERNPFNAVDITVGLSKEDPMYSSKRAYLARSGRDATSVRFPLQANRYPSELVDFLRLLLVEMDDIGMQDLERIDFNEPIAPSLERRVLTTIVSICESYLDQYPTNLEEDEKFMADRGLFGALSRQQRMAVKLRASEKRILNQTIKAVKDELGKLPAIVGNNDQPIVPAGRSFDTLRTRPTVSNARRASDWVEDKGAKPTLRASDEPSSTETTGTGEGPSVVERRRRRRNN